MDVRSYYKKRKNHLISEINITPMVDVVLVLLIIFMITSPMLVAGIDVDSSKSKSNSVLEENMPLVINITKEGKIFFTEKEVTFLELVDEIRSFTQEDKDRKIFIKGDQNVFYGKIIKVIAKINNAGFKKVALVSDFKEANER